MYFPLFEAERMEEKIRRSAADDLFKVSYVPPYVHGASASPRFPAGIAIQIQL